MGQTLDVATICTLGDTTTSSLTRSMPCSRNTKDSDAVMLALTEVGESNYA